MTRWPYESKRVHRAEGSKYTTAPVCSAPGCNRLRDHNHHVFPRGQMGGACDWVHIEELDVTVGNLIPLCFQHHADVTDDRVKIVLDKMVLWWFTYAGGRQPLSYQPPGLGSPQLAKQRLDHDGREPGSPVCPTCYQKLPRPQVVKPKEQVRERKTWAVNVPADAREDGADTLDTLLEAAREVMDDAGLPYSADSKAKFFVLSATLGLFVQHAQQILGSGHETANTG